MRRISIKFVLVSVAVVAACMATSQLPEFENKPYAVDASNLAPSETEAQIDYIWIKIIAIFIGGATFSNLITNCMGFTGFGKWFVGVGLPVFVVFGWYLIGLKNGTHGYGILGPKAPIVLFVAITFAFVIGFAVVNGVQATASGIPIRPQQTID